MSFSPSSSSSFFVEYNKDPSSTDVPKLVVLKSPTGHHIEDHYELGRGEFGITYLCTDHSTREPLACKSISKSRLRTAVDVDDVKREVEIMQTLPSHPNVVALRDAYEDDGAVHIVMELCKDDELFDRIVAHGHYIERATVAVAKTVVEVVHI